MKTWYQIKNKSSGVVDISLHDEIGSWGVTVKDFISELNEKENVTAINVSIHSPGGVMLDGLAMHEMLTNHPAKVYTKVEGMAASAASLVLMAGDFIEMSENSYVMIHNPWGVAFGESEEMRQYADMMDKFKQTAVNIYANRTGLDHDDVSKMMNDETWLDATEAKELGFIDTITDSIDIAASAVKFSKYFKSMPFDFDNKLDDMRSVKDFERCLRDSGGFSRSMATKLASKAKEIFQSDSENDLNADFEKVSAALMRLSVPKSLK